MVLYLPSVLPQVLLVPQRSGELVQVKPYGSHPFGWRKSTPVPFSRFHFLIMSKARSLILDWGNPYTFKQRHDGSYLALDCSQVGAQGEAQGEVQGRPRGHPPVRIRSRSHDASAAFRLSCVVRRLGILLPKKPRGARHRVTVVRYDGRLRQRVPARLERSSGEAFRQVEAPCASSVLPQVRFVPRSRPLVQLNPKNPKKNKMTAVLLRERISPIRDTFGDELLLRSIPARTEARTHSLLRARQEDRIRGGRVHVVSV